MSLSLTADHADLTKAFSSFVSAEKIPGESVKTTCVLLHVATPLICVLVVCTLGVTIAIFLPMMLLINVDFPAFGKPAMVTNKHFCSFTKKIIKKTECPRQATYMTRRMTEPFLVSMQKGKKLILQIKNTIYSKTFQKIHRRVC